MQATGFSSPSIPLTMLWDVPPRFRGPCAGTERKRGSRPRVRIGIHLGSVLQTQEGLVGQQVHIAARVASAGEGDEVLVSLETMDRVSGFDFERKRAITIKGISEPLMVGSLVWAD